MPVYHQTKQDKPFFQPYQYEACLGEYCKRKIGRSTNQVMRQYGGYLGRKKDNQSRELLQIHRQRRLVVCIKQNT